MGIASLKVCSTVTPAIGLVTKRVMPKEGVARPMTRLMQMIAPICKGSTPSLHATGAMIGPRTTTDA